MCNILLGGGELIAGKCFTFLHKPFYHIIIIILLTDIFMLIVFSNRLCFVLTGTDDFSLIIKQLSNDLRDTEYTDSEVSVTDTVTEDSSVDFDLPDESQFLEASIRLTRKDINFAQSDDLNDNSSSDTDYVISDDDIVPNSTS